MTLPDTNSVPTKSIFGVVLNIIKGVIAFVVGIAVFIGGVATAIAKFVKSEHGNNLAHATTHLVHSAIEYHKIKGEIAQTGGSFWQKAFQLAIGLAILALVAVFGCLFQDWSARLSLNAGDKNASRGNHKNAIRNYSKAIKERPEYALAFHNRGLAELTLGQVDQAQKDFTRAHELDSSLPLLQV